MRKNIFNIFLYWINERHSIYLKRDAGEQWPWTNDPILQEYKFTNVFRQLDRVTKAWTSYYEEHVDAPYTEIFRNLMVFRMFNWPLTYAALGGWRKRPLHPDKMKEGLHQRRATGEQIFTGAYIITNNGLRESKIDLVCDAIAAANTRAASLILSIRKVNTLEHATQQLATLPMVGEFIAYELVTDLRHTTVLHTARDIMTWANPGPGARRGLNRIHGRPVKHRLNRYQAIEEMQQLLTLANQLVEKHVPELEMRDIEHSLCEFDKYMRVKLGEGRPRSKFTYPGDRA